VLHVGDSTIDDGEGGRNVGMQVVLIHREGSHEVSVTPIIQSLDELIAMLPMADASKVAGAS
jgi:FMN phosphatase YigB (HAD superfamily)